VEYFGMGGIATNQTVWSAAHLRKQWHREKPARVLRGCTLGKITLVMPKLRTKSDALVEEARATAKAWVAAEDNGTGAIVRGACWCRACLNASEKALIRAVAAATSRQEVLNLATLRGQAFKDLSAHLNGDKYSSTAPMPTVAEFPKFSYLLPPVAIAPTKKKSGKNYKPGRSNWKQWRDEHGAVPYDEYWPSNWGWFLRN
jgi:hypothetical protein